MTTPFRTRATLAAAILGLVLGGCTGGDANGPGPADDMTFRVPDGSGRWYKGNTHTHTTNSDGDSSPEYVANWYRNHGYDFLVLSDHNFFTDPASLAHVSDSDFLLIPGEEVTSGFDGASVHVNGLNIPHVIEARRAESLVATIQANVHAIREVQGVPHINHPNFGWSFGAAELRQIEDDRLLEIWNGHPTVHNEGGGGTPSLEAIWDILLTGGKTIYGIAVDDAHHFQGEFSADRSNPGRGWVEVLAESLEPDALMDALEAGHFYASTGVTLSDVVVTDSTLTVHIEQDRDFRYRTEFIGPAGSLLGRSAENPAVFRLSEYRNASALRSPDLPAGVTHYVRAKVYNSRGDVAWVQPVFLEASR
jgi:hypothetical protein